jgi:four helix bundle protein
MKPHKKLIAWQKGMDLVVMIYEVSKTFPKEETYGLTSQMRRAAISVPSNIAEDACDRSIDQFKNFLSIAIGSLNELNTQLEVAFRVGYIDEITHNKSQLLVDECLAVTYGLRRSLVKQQ